ncbi:hypothetical protein GCM10029976_099060 [Kribbella albertanoniae]
MVGDRQRLADFIFHQPHSGKAVIDLLSRAVGSIGVIPQRAAFWRMGSTGAQSAFGDIIRAGPPISGPGTCSPATVIETFSVRRLL